MIVFIATDKMAVAPITQFLPSSFTDFTTPGGIFLDGFLAFYAYIGFEDMVNIAEEIKQPEKILPKAILLAMVITTLLYIAVIYAALSVLPPEQLAASSAPLADVARTQGYATAWIGLIDVVNGAIVQMIMASWVVYGMASNRLLPEVLALVNPHTATPVRASILCIAITLLLALLFPLESLAQATSMIVLGVFTMVNIALIKITLHSPRPQSIRYLQWFPYIGAALCIALMVIKVGNLITLN